MKVGLQWKAVSLLRRDWRLENSNAVFNYAPNPGLFSQFAVPHPFAYVPQVLSPTPTFHHALRKRLAKDDIELVDRRLPYFLDVDDLGPSKINVSVRLFPPNIASLTLTVDPLEEPTDLITAQQLNRLRPLPSILGLIIGLMESLDQRRFEEETAFRWKPAVWLQDVDSMVSVADVGGADTVRSVGILIRNPHYERMSTDIVDRVIAKNHEINLKDSNELLLADKQGVLYATSAPASGALRRRFRRAHDLYEIAVAIAEFLSEYPALRTRDTDFADFLFTRTIAWIEKPDVVLAQSVSNRRLWDLLSGELGLSSRAEGVKSRHDLMEEVSAKQIYFDRFSQTWWQSSDFASVLSASIEEGHGFDLRFLDQAELRRVVIDDFQESRRAYESRSYKAALVLCGSIAEALLVASLSKASNGTLSEEDLSRLSLADLVDRAVRQRLIRDPALQSLLTPLRSYRNLIHPGVMLRTDGQPDEHKAEIALRTIRLLVAELRKAFEPS